MPKFFVNKEDICDHIITVTGENANHISNVLRAKIGDEITICDGEGLDYTCEITDISKKEVIAKITDITSNNAEPSVKITLFQALPKSDKMELVIQKCIEIGVDEIVAVATKHCVVNLSGKENKKLARWNKIAESAAKQCGRGKIPKVSGVMSFNEAIIKAKNFDLSIIPYEKEDKNSLKSICNNFKGKTIGVFIGPEGGFANEEIDFAKENQIVPVTLGKRILRTETAGLVTSVILLYELEE
ncbi:MAG: 16S rRNA (uracil(1498)-N(3))-methyltransferase [Lachnospirales bacterium]